MNRLLLQLGAEDHLTQITEIELFAARVAHYIAEINAIHPFREGNGRCQLTLLSILMDMSGFEMDENKIKSKLFMSAMIASFLDDNGPLTRSIVEMAV